MIKITCSCGYEGRKFVGKNGNPTFSIERIGEILTIKCLNPNCGSKLTNSLTK